MPVIRFLYDTPLGNVHGFDLGATAIIDTDAGVLSITYRNLISDESDPTYPTLAQVALGAAPKPERIEKHAAVPLSAVALGTILSAGMGEAAARLQRGGAVSWLTEREAPPAAVTVAIGLIFDMAPGVAQDFEAVITGVDDQSVTWRALDGGSFDGATFTAPALAGRYRVEARSSADPAQVAVAVVVVRADAPSLVRVRVVPATATIVPGGTLALTATVVDAQSVAVSWATSVGEIVPDGADCILTAPVNAVPGDVVTVTVASVEDPTATATCTITVVAP